MPRTDRAVRSSTAPLCVELHDVAPLTWGLCARLLAMIDALGPLVGPIPLSLLVVPDYHHRGRITGDPAFLQAIDARITGGDEVALHGYHHLDEGPAPSRPADWFRRRVRTFSEGELAATDDTAAAECIALGRAEFAAAGWSVTGFVPPAWLLGSAARTALSASSFSYTAVRNGFYRLPNWEFIPATMLSYAAFSPWRRVLSKPVLEYQFRRADPARPLRLALHPVDARHPRVLEHWRTLLLRALQRRNAMTAAAIVETHRRTDARTHGVVPAARQRGTATPRAAAGATLGGNRRP
ncbi:MAG: polysaccharide deacetylase family protein [Betaproteobacteria bacterium]